MKPLNLHFTSLILALEVTSASLPVPLDATAGEEFVGVQYCKLWSPADALRFVLE
ncbi:MAG: hypothetical protein WBM75_18700 [Polyangiales bacterium]